MKLRLRLYKPGLWLVGLGELIADAGAWLADCRRMHSHLVVTHGNAQASTTNSNPVQEQNPGWMPRP